MSNYLKIIISLVICLAFCLPKETKKVEAASTYSGKEQYVDFIVQRIK